MTAPGLQAAVGGLRHLCAALLLGAASMGASAQNLKATPADIKAAYLLKLPGFVEWPAADSSDAPFVILVVEADEVARALEESSRGVKVMGRPVRVVRALKGEAPVHAHLVFVGAAVKGKPAVLTRERADGALIVSDQPTGLAEGAALQFIESDGRIRFDAAPANALRHGTKLSARLLSVAARVEGGAAP